VVAVVEKLSVKVSPFTAPVTLPVNVGFAVPLTSWRRSLSR
jgi:hypothetical protein